MSYLDRAVRHQSGMAAAASRTAARRLSGEALATVRRQNNERYPCKIKGCARTAHKGFLCRGHYALVPQAMPMDLVIESMHAQRKIAAKHHRKQLAYVRSLLL